MTNGLFYIIVILAMQGNADVPRWMEGLEFPSQPCKYTNLSWCRVLAEERCRDEINKLDGARLWLTCQWRHIETK